MMNCKMFLYADTRKGACWASVKNGRCEQLIGGLILRSVCCGTVGKAWGSPCEPCPLELTTGQQGKTLVSSVGNVFMNFVAIY